MEKAGGFFPSSALLSRPVHRFDRCPAYSFRGEPCALFVFFVKLPARWSISFPSSIQPARLRSALATLEPGNDIGRSVLVGSEKKGSSGLHRVKFPFRRTSTFLWRVRRFPIFRDLFFALGRLLLKLLTSV